VRFDHDARPARTDRRDASADGDRRGQRSSNDWYPRTGSQGGNRKPGGYGRPLGDRSRDGGQVGARPTRDGRPAREGSTARDSRPVRNDRQSPARDGREGGRGYGAPAGRPGYAAGRNASGTRRGPGQGRHY
jgi:hypothetical protein